MEGVSFGAARPVSGEVVFNTGMAGYVETLTDPSYCGQILVLTYPLVGNYGVPAPRPPGSIDRPYESSRIQVQGLVVQNHVTAFSHRDAVRSLGSWLSGENVPAVSGIDTRTLTRRLRERGTMRGWLYPSSLALEDARKRGRRRRHDARRLPSGRSGGAGDARPGRAPRHADRRRGQGQYRPIAARARRDRTSHALACRLARRCAARRRHRHRQRARGSGGPDRSGRERTRAPERVGQADLRGLPRQSDPGAWPPAPRRTSCLTDIAASTSPCRTC